MQVRLLSWALDLKTVFRGLFLFSDFFFYNNYWGVPALPSASGSKSAAGSRVAAKLQKELPPVALLQQRPHRLPSLRAFHLPPHAPELAPIVLCSIMPIIKLKKMKQYKK